jgi:hypothetical protein
MRLAMSKLVCERSNDAVSWLETCRPLFHSDLETYNIPHGFGQAVVDPPDQSSRFAYVKDVQNNAIIQGIIRAKDSWPTIFSLIRDAEKYNLDEIAKLLIDCIHSTDSESSQWDISYARNQISSAAFSEPLIDLKRLYWTLPIYGYVCTLVQRAPSDRGPKTCFVATRKMESLRFNFTQRPSKRDSIG